MFYPKWIEDISWSQEFALFVLEKHKRGKGKMTSVRANQHLLCKQKAVGHNSAPPPPQLTHTYSLVFKAAKKTEKL